MKRALQFQNHCCVQGGERKYKYNKHRAQLGLALLHILKYDTRCRVAWFRAMIISAGSSFQCQWEFPSRSETPKMAKRNSTLLAA